MSKCSKCGEDVDKLYHQGSTHLCDTCLQTVTHIQNYPVICRVCGKIITSTFSLLNRETNERYCSTDCLAKAVGFYTE